MQEKYYDYRSIQKISKKGIRFYLERPVVVFCKKGIFVNGRKRFHKLQFTIEEMGFTTYDLS